MSDDAEQFYSAWSSVFGFTPQKLLCTWHVDRAWRKALKKHIKSQEVQALVYATLRWLQHLHTSVFLYLSKYQFFSWYHHQPTCRRHNSVKWDSNIYLYWQPKRLRYEKNWYFDKYRNTDVCRCCNHLNVAYTKACTSCDLICFFSAFLQALSTCQVHNSFCGVKPNTDDHAL